MDMDNYVSILKEKYNYSDELTEFLKKVIPTIITYYGEEYKDRILEAFQNFEIHFQQEDEDMTEYVNEQFNEKNDKLNLPCSEFMMGAFYTDKPVMVDGELTLKAFVYMPTKKAGIYEPFDFNDKESIGKLIHEICHAIKSYGHVKNNNGTVESAMGLMKNTWGYDEETKEFTDGDSINRGLEEGLNCYDEEMITSMYFNEEYKAEGYALLMPYIKRLMENKEFVSAVRDSQFNFNDNWKEKIGENFANTLATELDKLVDDQYNLLKYIAKKDTEKLDDLKARSQNLAGLIINYEESQKLVDQMAQGVDVLNENTEVKQESNSMNMGFAKVWILGLITTVISIGIIVLGVMVTK